MELKPTFDFRHVNERSAHNPGAVDGSCIRWRLRNEQVGYANIYVSISLSLSLPLSLPPSLPRVNLRLYFKVNRLSPVSSDRGRAQVLQRVHPAAMARERA